ncbi:MAG: copper amine oxidase N-terminal domain-containing protein, partial [Rubrobacteridae bacterium]|nr:copper amine oxidase N-terminal domain-containing protein [Rubrobacteridae bacterium]
MRKTVTLICLLALLAAIPGFASIGYAATSTPSAPAATYQSSAQTMTELTFTIGSKEYLVGKTKKTLSAAPFTKDARTLIPIRYVIEAIGGNIDWNQDAQETSITVGTTSILMKVGESTA